MKRGMREWLVGGLAALGLLAGTVPARAGAPVPIYSFTSVGGADGSNPEGALVADAAGNLYGTTTAGGQAGHGTVFRLRPPASPAGSWTETVLHSFTGGIDGGSDGAYPLAGLVFDSSGNLYGTTNEGGISNATHGSCGIVFELSPPAAGQTAWTETVLHQFTCGADGGISFAPLIADAAGNLYGTAADGGDLKACSGGCGVVFQLSRSISGTWTEKVLYAFAGSGSGTGPLSGLIFDKSGNLYGTTTSGGTAVNCCGVVFELSRPASPSGAWTETVLHSFNKSDGRGPRAGVAFDAAGNLYGTTEEGAGNGTVCRLGCGVVFELSPPATLPGSWAEKPILRFFGGAGGGVGTSAIYQNGHVYGTAGAGSYGGGVVFALTPYNPPRKYWNEMAYSFTGHGGSSPGANPYGALINDLPVSGTGTFYGTTEAGSAGNVYSWTP